MYVLQLKLPMHQIYFCLFSCLYKHFLKVGAFFLDCLNLCSGAIVLSKAQIKYLIKFTEISFLFSIGT